MDEPEFFATEDAQDQAEVTEAQIENFEATTGNVPYPSKHDSLYTLFQKVWKTPDSSKVANLNSVELGRVNISVRDMQYLALLGRTLRHKKFAEFFMNHGEIVLATSASKKGWFTELFVSQKKYTTRATASQTAAQAAAGAQRKWYNLSSKQNPGTEGGE